MTRTPGCGEGEAALQAALRRLLGPLARLAVTRGVPHSVLDELLRQALVKVADDAHRELPPQRRVSRISTTTGLHRREAGRLLQALRDGETAGDVRRPSRASQVLAHWLASPAFTDRRGRPRVLPRQGPAPSFEALAREEKKGKGYIAPFKAIEAMERGLSDDFEADLKIEAQLFSDCAVSDVAKNLIGIFLNTRAAGKLPRIKGVEPQKIKTVAMLGGGNMGSGITNLLLSNRFETILWDINEEAIQKGLAAIRKTFAYPIKIGKMTQEELDRKIQDHVTTTTSLDDMKRADLIIETVLEDMNIKQGIWKKLQEICRPEVTFATNTSALPITEMASILKDPGTTSIAARKGSSVSSLLAS